jgi:two-component system chemotaxis response regulator CheB
MGPAEKLHEAAAQSRVMLVEDSAVVRGMVRKWLEAVPGVVVVGAANNGQVAIQMAADTAPDIIILDLEMPVMDGLTALPELVRRAPKAKIIIASTLSRRNAEVTLKAMALGASDYILKPSFAREGNDARAAFQDELLRKIVALSGARSHPERRSAWTAMPEAGAKFSYRPMSSVLPRVLAIGSSTGGPAALSKVLEAAGSDLRRVPVLIAQHMPATFTALLGEKLAALAGLAGGEAKHGEVVVPGRLYVAPGGQHMEVEKQGAVSVIALNSGPPINHCRPAVDPLFESVARVFGSASLGVILTGMGSDGAHGARAIADAGGSVLAQDEASSVVWGMPAAALNAGVCAAQVSLDDMGKRIDRCLSRGVRS